MWKRRYSKEEYPIKIAGNLLYEGLTSLLIWNSNYFSFNGKSIYKYFDDAWNDAYNAIVSSIQTDQILPSLNHIFNESEKNSIGAERESLDRYSALFMSKHIDDYFDGIVSGSSRSCIFIKLKKHPIMD